MERASTTHRMPLLLFGGVVIAVYATAITLAGMMSTLERPGVVATGMTLDLIFLVPVAFYFLVVRRRGLRIVTLVPVVVLSFVAANLILPAERKTLLGTLELLAIPLEVGLIGWIAWSAVRALRQARRGEAADPLLQFHRAGFDLLHSDRLAAIFATEIAVFYYVFFSWRARPHLPAATAGFAYHRLSGHAGILIAILMLVLVEGIGVHFLLSLWSRPVAWIFTLLSAYSAVWLIGDFRASVLRPILFADDMLHFRAGLRWTLQVPRERIAGVQASKPELGRQAANFTLLGSPSHWIVFTEPVELHGLYGVRSRVRAIGVQPDDPADFDKLVKSESA